MKENKISIQELLMILVSMAVIAWCVYYIMMADGLVLGSVSGLVLVLMKVIPLSASVLTFILNIGLLVIGYIFIGREFGLKTFLTSILLPMYLFIYERISPNPESISGNLILDIVVFMVVLSFAQAVLFHLNASTGGLDIVGKLLNKYLHVKMGVALQIAGIVVCVISVLVYDRQTMVTGLVVTYVNGLVVDHFSDGFLTKKKVCVISDKYLLIQDYIINILCRGATLYQVVGAATNEPRVEIQTLLETNEYAKLLEFVQEVDPNAFLTTGNVSEVVGQWNNKKRYS